MLRRRRLKSSRGNRMRCRRAIDPSLVGQSKTQNRPARKLRDPRRLRRVSDTQAGYATNLAFDKRRVSRSHVSNVNGGGLCASLFLRARQTRRGGRNAEEERTRWPSVGT